MNIKQRMKLREHGAVTRTGEMEMRATNQLKILMWKHFGDLCPGTTVINEMDLLQTGCVNIGPNQVNWWYTILCKHADTTTGSTKDEKIIYQLRESQLSNEAYSLNM
jgi:hypothetical protein